MFLDIRARAARGGARRRAGVLHGKRVATVTAFGDRGLLGHSLVISNRAIRRILTN
jgi:hypothetical protein